MNAGKWGVGMSVTGLTFFVGAGIAHNFLSIGPALLVGVAIWIACACSFANAMSAKSVSKRARAGG